MRSIGVLKTAGEEYVVMIIHQKSVTYFYLLSKYHRDDQNALLFGNMMEYPERTVMSYAIAPVDNNYISAVICKRNIGGSMQYYGMYPLLLEVINAIQTAVSYSFKPQYILLDDTKLSDKLEPVRQFCAKDDELQVEYRKVGGFIADLKYRSLSIDLQFREEPQYKYPKTREITPLLMDLKAKLAGTKIYHSNVKTIDYSVVLESMVDHEWYVKFAADGSEEYQKDYVCVKDKNVFEKCVIMGLVNEIKRARAEGDLPVLVSIDTETNGLNVYDVPHEHQSRVVAIPFSFKDDTGFVIFTDMEYFENISIEYVRERMEPFLRKDLADDPEITLQTIEGPFTFRRSEIFCTGHNVMFDVRAFLVHDMHVWFDADTRQLSFNLDPFLTKRKNSLKYITHKLLKCWTPTLTDVLGEGNEDQFRYLPDERVAALYGGSDADFGRLVFKALKNIYAQCRMFHRKDLYQACLDQDVLLMNFVATFDFAGLRIDRERFVSEGIAVAKDIEIITNFAHKYVGRMIAANNYLHQRKMIMDANLHIKSSIALMLDEHKHDKEFIQERVEELERQIVDPDSIPKPDLKNAPPYVFKFAGNDLITTLYGVLNYPVLVWTEPSKSKTGDNEKAAPRPAVNKRAMKFLMRKKGKGNAPVLSQDIPGHNGKPLIKADEFNSYKYPVAYLSSLLGPRKKEYESYFAPFVEDSFDDRLCKDTSFASIDTRRISNSLQTMKGSLKYYILPHNPEYAMFDFDMSQVELRMMASLAFDEYTMARMNDPEVDAHIECASDMSIGISKFHKAAYLINKTERKRAKSVNFGYPYGLGRYSMCEQIFGETTDENLAMTQKIIEAFERARKKIVDFLNAVRDQTLKPVGSYDEEPVDIPLILRNYLELGDTVPIGIVRNIKGFYKLFRLDDMTDKKAARIRRQAGNYPIQSSSAELFRIILIRLFTEFWKLGWWQKGWIKGHMLVHDEFLFSFLKREIHVVHLMYVVNKCCTVRVKGHTTYYIGINVGNSWGECKEDDSELPVHCVERLAKRWEAGEFAGEVVDDPRTYMARHKQEYITERIWEVVHSLYPGLCADNVDCGEVLDKLKNYTVRKYVYDCYPYLWSPAKSSKGDMDDTDAFNSKFANWALDCFGDNVGFITSDKKKINLHSDLRTMNRVVDGEMVPCSFEEMFEGKVMDIEQFLDSVDMTAFAPAKVEEESYYKDIEWSLDGSNPYYIDYERDSSDADSEDFGDQFDVSLGNTVETMRKVRPTEYTNIQIAGNKAIIKISRKKHISMIEAALKKTDMAGAEAEVQIFYLYSSVPVKGSFVRRDYLKELDEIITTVRK